MEPEARYRPVERTPPDYQTVIKLLLVASLLDVSLYWADGPSRTSRGAALGARDMELPAATRQALQQLGVAEKDWPSPGLRNPSFVVRVFGLLLFNSVVLWTDVGSYVLCAVDPVLWGRVHEDSTRLAPPGLRWANGSCHGGQGGAPHQELLVDSHCAEATVMNRSRVDVTASPATPSDLGDDAEASTWGRSAAGRALSGVLGAFLSCGPGPNSTEGVPWFAQLVSLALLVLVVYAVPRCPIVLESACNFLMC